MPPVTASRANRSDGIPIGELSRLTGINIETIRYYEKIKMLRPPPRTEGGRRVYGPNETRLLAFIRRGRELGFGLDDIRALLALGALGKASCADVREIAAHILVISAPRLTTSGSSKGARKNNQPVFWKQGAGLPCPGHPRCQASLKSNAEGATHHVG